MKKQFIYILMILCTLFSCVTPSQNFLAYKHEVGVSKVKILNEQESEVTYSPIFDLRDVLTSSASLTKENYDSINMMYQYIMEGSGYDNNCKSYNVSYVLKGDTLQQRVYFIRNANYHVTHDNDAIDVMHSLIRLNFKRYQRREGLYLY